MKQRSTTPVSKVNFTAKACIIAVTILSLALTPFAAMPVKADRYDAQIAALQRQIDSYNSQAGALREKGNTLQVALDRLTNEKKRIQAQLDINIAKEKKLEKEIAANQKKLDENKSLLGDTIVDIYMNDNVSALERLAGSEGFADFIDDQANRDQVQDSVASTIDQINILKKKLEEQKIQVQRVVADQKTSRDALAKKEAEQAELVRQTRGQQSAYERLSSKTRAEQGRIREAQQAAIAARIASSGGASVIEAGVSGGYPWGQSNCPMQGYWSTGGSNGNGGDGYGYGCRQCASYAAWRVAKETGYYPANWGNATNFPANARNAGYSTSGSYNSSAGSRGALGVMHAQSAGVPEGHVVYVEPGSYSNGQITISQYNYNYGAGYGMYSKMRMSVSAFDEFIYLK